MPLMGIGECEMGHGWERWSGERPIGRLERLAYERHDRDLKEGAERGLWFDVQAADRVVDIFRKYVRHVEGEWYGKPFILSPWQEFIERSLFGWMKLPDGMKAAEAERIGKGLDRTAAIRARVKEGIYRRFHEAWVEVPKKNGKSPLAAGTVTVSTLVDGEYGAKNVSAATKRDQARNVWETAKKMVLAHPDLRRRVKVSQTALFVPKFDSKFMAISSDAGTEDGVNINFAVVDEVHRHATPDLINLITMSFGTRRQPMLFKITTSGDGTPGIWLDGRKIAENILERIYLNDSIFVYIAAADKEDDWRLEDTWKKANPNWGISVKADRVREEFETAQQSASMQASFKRLRLNWAIKMVARWLNLDKWMACEERGMKIEDMAGRPCWLGMDLSSRIDLTSLMAIFPPGPEEREWRIWPWFWLPEEAVMERVKSDRVQYDRWVEEGWIEATPGPVVDYDYVKKRIDWVEKTFPVAMLCFDPHNAQSLMNDLNKAGIRHTLEVRQGYKTLSSPMKEVDALIRQGLLKHPGNPAMTWCMANVVARKDENDNIAPDKKKSIERIDGASALVTGMAMLARGGPVRSVYEERGVMMV